MYIWFIIKFCLSEEKWITTLLKLYFNKTSDFWPLFLSECDEQRPVQEFSKYFTSQVVRLLTYKAGAVSNKVNFLLGVKSLSLAITAETKGRNACKGRLPRKGFATSFRQRKILSDGIARNLLRRTVTGVGESTAPKMASGSHFPNPTPCGNPWKILSSVLPICLPFP